MYLLICGGRNFNNEDLMVNTINYLIEAGTLPHESEITVISGMARGADMLAYEIAKANDMNVIEMPADWKQFGKTAGYIRNVEMLKRADYVLAFWDGKTRGTEHTINKAKKMGIATTVVKF